MIGYGLSSYFLTLFIDPTLTPTIPSSDTRWLGAWWISPLIIGALSGLIGFLMGLFPKTLPEASREEPSAIELESLNQKQLEEKENGYLDHPKVEPEKATFNDFWISTKRLLSNRLFLSNLVCAVCRMFGYCPFVTFQSKYIEVLYQMTPSAAK